MDSACPSTAIAAPGTCWRSWARPGIAIPPSCPPCCTDQPCAAPGSPKCASRAPRTRPGSLPSQAKVLLALEEAGGALMEPELLETAEVGASVLSTLEKRGLIERMKRVDLLGQRREAGVDRTVVLNEEQRTALEAVKLGTFGVHLLHGVTGSGKTEVYLALAERVLAAGRRVLWLVPEIGLTGRLLDRLEARFPGRIAVGHAGLNAGEKQGDVVRLLFNGADLFVGVRNAVLAPLRDIGLIVVDEEQEGSYKSEEHPRIHARDLAIKRAQLEGCPILLGSATPSLESWQAAQSGRYQLLRLRERPAGDLPAQGRDRGPAGVLTGSCAGR
jgi:primosomal protein N' (replication factor Y)